MSLGWLSSVSGASPPRLPPWLLGVPKRHGCEYHAFFYFVCHFTNITLKRWVTWWKSWAEENELDLGFCCRDNSWNTLKVASDTSTDVLNPKPVWYGVCCLLCHWQDFAVLYFVGLLKYVQDCNASTRSHDIKVQLWETGADCSVWRM